MDNSLDDIKHLEDIKDKFANVTEQLANKIIECGNAKSTFIILESQKKKLEQMQSMALETLRTAKLRFNALERR